MIHLNPRFFIVLTWVLIGPSAPLLLTVVCISASVILAILFRRSFHLQTVALFAILAVMFTQSLQLIVLGLHIDVFKPSPPATLFPLVSRTMWNVPSTLFALDLWFAGLGAVTAVFLAAYLYFGKSRLQISEVLARGSMIEPTLIVRQTTAKLASRANITCPDVYLIDSGTPLAFTARTKSKYVIALSVGLLESFDDKEVEACLAHEIAHLKNNDFIFRFAATLAKVALFSRPLGYLIEPAIFRAREFQADKTAASLLGGPAGLVSVLKKLRESNSLPSIPSASGSSWACFLDIRKGAFSVFNKHPSLGSRIRLLEELEAS
jgi:heat shock protein HtpX